MEPASSSISNGNSNSHTSDPNIPEHQRHRPITNNNNNSGNNNGNNTADDKLGAWVQGLADENQQLKDALLEYKTIVEDYKAKVAILLEVQHTQHQSNSNNNSNNNSSTSSSSNRNTSTVAQSQQPPPPPQQRYSNNSNTNTISNDDYYNDDYIIDDTHGNHSDRSGIHTGYVAMSSFVSSAVSVPRRRESKEDAGVSVSQQQQQQQQYTNKDGVMRTVPSPIPIDTTTTITTANTTTTAHATATTVFLTTLCDRAGWLVGLLILQSMSSFIIADNEELLQQHPVIIQFLTMLIGAGGNAGNQASVRVIRGIALGTISSSNLPTFFHNEMTMGFCVSIIVSVAGFLRACVFLLPWPETLAITISLWSIVITSIVIGALLPFGMNRIGIDPAHASTTIQVIMDIVGVLITVQVSSWILDTVFQDWE